MLFPIRIDSNQLVANRDKALSIIRESSLNENTKQRLYELLEFDIDSPNGNEAYDWDELADSVDNFVPENATIPEVEKLRNTIHEIKQGLI